VFKYLQITRKNSAGLLNELLLEWRPGQQVIWPGTTSCSPGIDASISKTLSHTKKNSLDEETLELGIIDSVCESIQQREPNGIPVEFGLSGRRWLQADPAVWVTKLALITLQAYYNFNQFANTLTLTFTQ